MSFKHSNSPGVSAFVAKMRVRAAHPQGAILPAQSTTSTLAWRVSPASGHLERCLLDPNAVDAGRLRGLGHPRD
ncbi:hypothetical protein ACFW0H_08840 [Pseudomonas sp. CR3202]|uniref:hypothetical protein n=1 Tax=Pseudomonas sp. CR3202 TaxID=3351532 RepID=UPI003BF21DC5